MANPARKKGTHFEVAVAEYMDAQLPLKVERRASRGARDIGDISGVPGLICEVKNHKALELGKWMNEAEREADEDGGSLPILWHKRRGQTHPASNYVTMPGWAFMELLKAWLV